MIIKEAMRLYPPVYTLGRMAIENATIGGHIVRKGSLLSVLTYALHHDARWWDEPERFMPERWAEPYPNQPPKYAYIPFGAGPRVCIGNSFAMMEACLVLATIAQRYRLSLAPGHVVEPHLLVTLTPRNGLPMQLEKR
jgi:cytochrome P450